jgi:[ribosomal protein S5]-alanine N-acetyltransferase
MEKMPYQAGADAEPIVATVPVVGEPAKAIATWRYGLSPIRGSMVTLRELRRADATALFAALTSEETSRFISPPPTTVDGFERFIAWARRQREAGQYVCFAVVPKDSDVAIGLFQIRALDPDFGVGEWGFAIASEFWGSGVFVDGAKLVLDFAFATIGVHRLEARAATVNGRGNAALRKIGATRECVLRKSFLRCGEWFDQALWTLLRDDWLAAKTVWGSLVIH